jgi:glycosyltransferase involved in cell wall biosynthesis
VLLVHLKDDPLFSITIPSKTQAYLASGRPILMAVRGDSSDLVKSANAGISCEPENSDSIAQGIERLYNMPQELRHQMGENGRKYYEAHLSLKSGVTKFERIFESAIRP